MLSFVYVKTETGRQAFKERLPDMLPKLRSAFILFDGVRNLEAVLSATAGLGITATEIMALVERGYIVAPVHDAAHAASDANALSHSQVGQDSNSAASSGSPEASSALTLTASLTWQQERFKQAYPIAAQLTAGLGLRGFRLHLAVEGAQNYEQLMALAPKIREVIGVGKSQAFERALGG